MKNNMPYFVKAIEQDTYGIYGSTEAIQVAFPELKTDTVKYHTSRKKRPYITAKYEVYYCAEIIRSGQDV